MDLILPETIINTNLPTVTSGTTMSVQNILSALNLPREVIASNEEIEFAWRELPREIARIPIELRDGLIARMCVATSVGLFDGAINYAWNAVIINMRTRAKNFGLGYISQTLNRKFEEDDLNDLMDTELLDLCHKLDLLSEESYFFLNQCRDIRNNFSSAHPSIAQIDDRELINFISRCCKHGISSDYELHGINTAEFINVVKANKIITSAIEFWKEKLTNTFSAQRALLLPMLHGIYCDPDSKEEARINAFQICESVCNLFDSMVTSSMIAQHNSYKAKSDVARTKASRLFFRKLNLLGLLENTEKHSIVREACAHLMRVHNGLNNFYNEPPFARNLREITESIGVPATVQEEYVQVAITCYVGNPYGVSHVAINDYQEMIENFSPKEIEIMLKVPTSQTVVANRITTYPSCKKRYISALQMLDEESFTPSLRAKYESIKKKFNFR